MSWKKVKLGKFLKVRDNRFKPNDIAIADLKRIDKIDFSGEIFISDKQFVYCRTGRLSAIRSN